MDNIYGNRAYDILEFGAILQSDGSYLHNDGDIFWYNEAGHIHREDGPAVIHDRGYWYYLGVGYSFDDWCIKTNKTDEDKMLLRLQYG
jgi:hypothetical protein